MERSTDEVFIITVVDVLDEEECKSLLKKRLGFSLGQEQVFHDNQYQTSQLE